LLKDDRSTRRQARPGRITTPKSRPASCLRLARPEESAAAAMADHAHTFASCAIAVSNGATEVYIRRERQTRWRRTGIVFRSVAIAARVP
jgi:hypothetical protein